MIEENFEVNAAKRDFHGKGAMRRMRRTNEVPAVVYGGHGEPQSIKVYQNEMRRHLDHEAFYSHILTLKIDGAAEQVVLKDLQRHPFRDELIHVDFQRVVAGEALTREVPLHFVNEDDIPGVKEGGVVDHVMNEVEVRCLPKNLPEYLEVDMAGMEIGDTRHLSDIKLPEGVELIALSHDDDEDLTIATVVVPRAAVEEDTDDAEAGDVPTVGDEEAAEDEADAESGDDK